MEDEPQENAPQPERNDADDDPTMDPSAEPSTPAADHAADASAQGDVNWGRDVAEHLLQKETIPRVPLFPLPSVVLFPGAVLPLHVFEKRYRVMMAEALGEAGDDARKLICVCRIRPGHDPMDDQPPLFETACIGRILDHRLLPDGRYDTILQGLLRVRLGRELPLGESTTGRSRPFRRADLHPLRCNKAFEIDLGGARERMKTLCRRPPIAGTPVARQLERLFASPACTSQLADVLAFDLIEDIDEKQALLEQLDERRRVEHLAELLQRQFPATDSLSKLGNRFDTDD